MKHISSLVLDLPIKTISEINRHEHWGRQSRRRKTQQKEVNIEWKMKAGTNPFWLPCRVTFTRIGPKLLDDDNLRSAIKGIRDEVARLLKVDDNPNAPVEWLYKQEAIGKHNYRVLIEVVSV